MSKLIARQTNKQLQHTRFRHTDTVFINDQSHREVLAYRTYIQTPLIQSWLPNTTLPPPLPNFREYLYGIVRCISCPSPVSLVKAWQVKNWKKNYSRIVSGRRAEVFTREKIVPRERVTLPTMARQLALPRVSHSETSSPSLCEWSVKYFKGINEKLVQLA